MDKAVTMTLGSVMDELNVMMNLTKIQIFAQIVRFSFTIYVYANDLKTVRNKLCITVADIIMFHKNCCLVQELRN